MIVMLKFLFEEVFFDFYIEKLNCLFVLGNFFGLK